MLEIRQVSLFPQPSKSDGQTYDRKENGELALSVDVSRISERKTSTALASEIGTITGVEVTMEFQLKRNISYKNYLIFSESFQLSQSSSWIPRYTLTRREPTHQSHASSSHHDRLDKVFGTESEADEFALQDAMHRIDEI